MLPQLEQFCFVQRFRSGKDLIPPPSFARNQLVAPIDSLEEVPEPIRQAPAPVQAPVLSYKEARNSKKKAEAKFKDPKEKERYFTALKALVNKKTEKTDFTVPNLCSCGALAENLKKHSESKTKGFMVTHFPCANNCPFYKKPKELRKALAEIIDGLS